MPTTRTAVSVTSARPSSVQADALVLATRSVDGTAELIEGPGLPRAVTQAVSRALTLWGAQGSADELVRLTEIDKVAAPLVLVVGTGSDRPRPGVSGPDEAERVRRAAGVAARALAGKDRAVFALGPAELAEACGEGALLGSYVFQTYFGVGKTGTAKPPLGEVVLAGGYRWNGQVGQGSTAEVFGISTRIVRYRGGGCLPVTG